MKKLAMFHAHLDECKQCANNPFALCSKGAQLLLAATKETQ